MAEGKKSFVAYADWKDIFNELPDDDAGKLIKHIFAYVNDENPKSESVLIRAVFANIKATLKRDLEKWDRQLEQRSQAGKASAEARKTKSNESNDRSTLVNETTRKATDSVSVSDSVSDLTPTSLKEFDVNDEIDVSQLTKHEALKNQALKDEIWKESVFMQKLLKPENIEFALRDYNIHLTQQSLKKNTAQDYKSHFVNWVKKRKEIVKSQTAQSGKL